MTTTVRERPILFRPEMVKAILDGRKTETRRILRPQPLAYLNGREFREIAGNLWGAFAVVGGAAACRSEDTIRCPFGAPGDRLWVRESWWEVCAADGPPATEPGAFPGRSGAFYRAEHPEHPPCPHYSARPPIHMPRWASRLSLEVTAVRVERVQAITEEGARAEGFERREHFARAWDVTNAKRAGCGFDADPWCWVVTFRRAAQ